MSDVYQRIRQLGHRIGERVCMRRAPYECVDCGMIATWADEVTQHAGELLEKACAGKRPEQKAE